MKLNMAEAAPSTLSRADLVECPRCAARLIFSNRPVPQIDSCGFESYCIKCGQCGAKLAGIIDPCDDRLLISDSER